MGGAVTAARGTAAGAWRSGTSVAVVKPAAATVAPRVEPKPARRVLLPLEALDTVLRCLFGLCAPGHARSYSACIRTGCGEWAPGGEGFLFVCRAGRSPDTQLPPAAGRSLLRCLEVCRGWSEVPRLGASRNGRAFWKPVCGRDYAHACPCPGVAGTGRAPRAHGKGQRRKLRGREARDRDGRTWRRRYAQQTTWCECMRWALSYCKQLGGAGGGHSPAVVVLPRPRNSCEHRGIRWTQYPVGRLRLGRLNVGASPVAWNCEIACDCCELEARGCVCACVCVWFVWGF